MINEQRVQRIKKVIYTLIAVVMILPFLTLIVIIVMWVRMSGLTKQVNELFDRFAGQPPAVTEQLYGDENLPDQGELSDPSVPGSDAGLDNVEGQSAGVDDPDTETDEASPPSGSAEDARDAGAVVNETAIPAGDAGTDEAGRREAPDASQDVSEPGGAFSPENPNSGRAPLPNTYTPVKYPALHFDTLPQPAGQVENTVYLSFDNTPNLYAEEILSVLDRHGVKATFFVWGNGTDDFYRRVVDSGHSIGIHSGSNTLTYSQLYASVDGFLEDFTSLFDRIYQVTGVKTRLYRLPGGSFHPGHPERQAVVQEISGELENRGFLQYDWNASGQDAVSPSPSKDEILANLRATLNDGQVVALLHDGTEATVQALDEFIAECLLSGYTFHALNDDTIPVSF